MATRVFKSGDFGTDTVTDIIHMWGKTATAGNVTHFRRAFATASTAVTGGTTLYVVRMRIMSSAAAAGFVKFGYADNDVGLDTATARTNPVMAIGVDDTNNNGIFVPIYTAGTSMQEQNSKGIPCFFPLAIATKHPFARVAGAAADVIIQLWCVER